MSLRDKTPDQTPATDSEGRDIMAALTQLISAAKDSAARREAADIQPSHRQEGADPICSMRFRGYKRLGSLDLHLRAMNILTGSNNAGKSTALSALRILASAMNFAKRRKAVDGRTPDGLRKVYHVPTEGLPISMENVHTDFHEQDTTVRFELASGRELTLYFPPDGGAVFYISRWEGRLPLSPSTFKKVFPKRVVHVPVLGPLEHKESMLRVSTVRRGLATHRAARHFRNYWYHFPEGFDRFARILAATWPGMEIEAPELRVEHCDSTLYMFCREKRLTRELYWAGFGFQIWCQLLTHVSRVKPGDTLVVDEPETYLHPIVQRRLLEVLRATGAQVMLATHSAPIVMVAGPGEVIQIDSSKPVARGLDRPEDALSLQLGLV